MDAQELIESECAVSSPLLAPEILLHLVTEGCRLWKAREKDLEALGLSDPYWAFAWPGGQALARYVIDHPRAFSGKTILDFGTGSGLVAIAAKWAGAERVVASDVDRIALTAVALNARLNDVEDIETTDRDLIGSDEGWDVILAADMCYGADMAARVLPWLERLADRGALVLLGDPGRGHARGPRLEEIAVYDAPSDVDSDGRIRVRTSILRMKHR